MVLFLEIRSGSSQGQKHRARPGLTIGRRQGDILLMDDGKVSGSHGKIELDNKGQVMLVDAGSANGFIINGRRVRKVALLPGLTFCVGDTEFAVIEVGAEAAEALEPRKTWRDHLRESLAKEPAVNRQIDGAAQSFTPAVELEFVQGPQADTRVTLGYGPRQAGHGHLDIDLIEPEAPELSFEILPGPGAALLRDHSAGKLTVNRKPVGEDQLLNEGDVIMIGSSQIKVRYM